MLKTLQNIGLKRFEAELYVYLMQNGQATANQLAIVLRTRSQRVYLSAKKLENKKMIRASQERPCRLAACELSEVIDILIAANKQKASLVELNREKLLEEWKKL